MSKRVIVTGASGLLGRAVADHLESVGNPFKLEVQRWVFTRIRPGTTDKKVNIGNRDDVFNAVDEYKPDAIIHCAAIRAPDIVDKQTDFAGQINVLGSQYIAEAAVRHKAKLIYISTDYVFDGCKPPYDETAQPNPLNQYGRQKLAGEKVVQQHCPDGVILRVPILYGPIEFVGEGAVDIILKNILRTDAPCDMSHYERRYPTHVYDVAAAIRLLLDRHFQNPESSWSNVKGIYHWSGDEEMTKFDMSKAMAEVFSLPITHLRPITDGPPPGSTAQRPYNSRLTCQRLLDLGARNEYNFKKGIEGALKKYVPGQKSG